jgi:hypothetical protein
VTSHFLQYRIQKYPLDARSNEVVTEDTSKGLEGKFIMFMLKNVTEELLFVRRIKQNSKFPQKVVSFLRYA